MVEVLVMFEVLLEIVVVVVVSLLIRDVKDIVLEA